MSKISNKIKKYISCPQFGNENYGEWGILTLEQRKLIKELAETCDMFEETADALAKENKELEHRLSNCIEPKFKIGDKIWAVCWQTFIGEKYNYEIVNGKIDHLFIDRDNQVLYGTMCQSFREQNLFATEEEAKAKLEELKNG